MRSNKVEGVEETSLDLNDEVDSEGEGEDEDEELKRERESMLQELLREIKEEEDEEIRPWISVSESSSGTEMRMSPDGEKVLLRFEDDFSSFVSADAGGYRMLGSESEGGYDLDEVYGVLQGYKAEIAGMGSEEERRVSAARVALGVVYDNYLHNS